MLKKLKNFFSVARGSNNQEKSLPYGRHGMPGPENLEDDHFKIQSMSSEIPTTPSYKINNSHRLEPALYAEDPDFGGVIEPKGIVIHFTCSYGLNSTVKWFHDQVVDIHLLQDKDGKFTQMVPFNRKAAHAGESKWRGYSGLNSFFLGIEVINIGPLKKVGEKFFDCYNREWKGQVISYETPVLGYKHWEPFTKAQLENLIQVCAELCKYYRIPPSYICGHHEASPGRKCDPGGSLTISMNDFRNLVEDKIRGQRVFQTQF